MCPTYFSPPSQTPPPAALRWLCWPLLYWLGAVHGSATAWHQAIVQNATTPSSPPPLRLRSKLLTLHVKSLRLKQNAPLTPKKPRRKSARGALRSV